MCGELLEGRLLYCHILLIFYHTNTRLVDMDTKAINLNLSSLLKIFLNGCSFYYNGSVFLLLIPMENLTSMHAVTIYSLIILLSCCSEYKNAL